LTSDEAYLGAIDSYYREFLGRDPGPAEVQSYLGLLISGTTPADITAVFLSSAEYINRQIALACG
jgi:hypothetical protein